jgi:hypothetical protein
MFIHTLHIFTLREPRARQRDRLMDEFEARKGMRGAQVQACNEREADFGNGDGDGTVSERLSE